MEEEDDEDGGWLPLLLESAGAYLTDPVATPGEVLGGVLGSAFGPLGALAGGAVGRAVESRLCGKPSPEG